jgi:YidC/Oxa1 family membrane protein insertase
MEKRILLSFALSFLVLLVFYQFLSPPPAQDLPPADPSVAEEPIPDSPALAVETVAAAPALGTEGAAAEGSPRAVQAESAETVGLTSRVYSVRVTNVGATLDSLRLLEYAGEGGETLELLDPEADASVGWPLALLTGDPELDAWLGSSLWAISGSSESRVRLELAADGVEAVKEIELLGDGYQLRVTASLLDGGRARPFTLLWQGSFGDQSTRYDPAQVNLVYQEEGDFDRLNVTDLEEAVGLPATRYLGVEDQYFLALLRSASPEVPEVGLERFQPADAEVLQPLPRAGLPYAAPVDIYVGPKRAEDLTAADPGLSAVIDYGFFSVLARPLLGILLWIQGYVGNFGWSIVLMTALINMALFPLRRKHQLSLLKMQ